MKVQPKISLWIRKPSKRVFAAFFFFVAACCFAFVWVLSDALHSTARQAAVQSTTNVSGLMTKVVGEHFEGLVHYLESYAGRYRFRENLAKKDWVNATVHLKDMVTGNASVDKAFFTDSDGNVVALYPPDPTVMGLNFAFREWFKSVALKRATIVSAVYRTASVPQPLVVAIATPIFGSDGVVLGYLTTLTRVETLAAWAGEKRPSPQGRILLLDHKNNLLAKLSDKNGESLDLSKEIEFLEGGDGSAEAREALDPVTKVPSFVGVSKVEKFGWRVLVTQPAAEVYAQANLLTRTIGVATALVGILLTILRAVWLQAQGRQDDQQLVALAEAKRQQEKFNESERRNREIAVRLHTVIENAPITLSAVDAEGLFTYSDGQGLATQGIKPGELVGQNAFVRFQQVEDLCDQIRRSLRGETVSYEFKMRTRWYLSHSSPILDADGKITGAVVFGFDTTTRKDAEEKAAVAEQQLRSVMNNMPSTLWAVNKDLICTVSEGKGLAALGLKSGEQVGLTLSELSTGLSNAMQLVARAMSGESFSQVSCMASSGRWMEIHFLPLLTLTGDIDGVLIVSTDVSDKMENERLSIREKSAQESSRLKSEFLANMSHEIRTPINGVIGLTGLLLDTSLTPEQAEFAHGIQSSGEILLTVINDILDFSKIEAGKLDFEETNFDLEQLLQDTVKAFSFAAVDAA